MDQILKQEMETLKTEFGKLSQKMDKVDQTMNTVLFALKGSDISEDKGLVGRIVDLEKDNDLLRDRLDIKTAALQREVDDLKVRQGKSDLFFKWMWILVGAVTTGVVGVVLKIMFKI